MKRFKILKALKGRIFSGYIIKSDGSVRNVWGQFSDKYEDMSKHYTDLQNDQIRFFDYTINPETEKPNGFRIMKAENTFSLKSGNTYRKNVDGKYCNSEEYYGQTLHYEWATS